MTPIKIACPQCDKVFLLVDTHDNGIVTCPSCGRHYMLEISLSEDIPPDKFKDEHDV